VKIRLEAHGAATLVIPEGRLDFGAATGFQAQLEQVLAGVRTAPAAVIIDCAGLEYVSSAGLRVFLLAARSSQRAGVRFAMCSLQPAVREVFELSGFNRVIAVHTDRGVALAPLSQGAA
jgi:anti-sigma B factor antagonist